MVTLVSQTATTQNIFVSDSKAVTYSQANYCGERIYTLKPTYGFLAISGDVVTL